MKNLQWPGLCLALIFACISSSAQEHVRVNEPDQNKPKLFASLPDRIPVSIETLQSLLNAETGKNINLLVDGSVAEFNGKVVSRSEKYNNIKSVVIRSSNFNGANFTLSSSIRSNGAVKFTGRIMSIRHRDLYELEFSNNQYTLVKKNLYDLMNE